MYSWKQIQREAAEHLLQYRTNQQELLNTLRAMKEAGLNTVPLEDQAENKQQVELTEIDPFTFFSTFNRTLTPDKLKANWAFLKDRWNLQAPIPTDFVGAPILHPQNCWFFGWKPVRQTSDIPNLWTLAEQVLQQGWDAVSPELFAKCLQIRAVALPKLTTGLFWIAPEECLVLNGTTNAYLAEHGISVRVESKEDYDEVMDAVRGKFQVDFPTLSHQAYTAKQAEAEGKLTPETLARLWQDFRTLFPDFVSFEHPGVEFAKQELTHKRKALQTLADAGGREHIRQLVEIGKAQEALKFLIKVAGGKFAAFQSWTKSIGDGDEAKVAAMLTAFLNVTDTPIEGPADLEPIIAVAKANGLDPAWDTIGVLLWELSPAEFLPVKISYYRKFATEAGLSLPSGAPTAASLFKLLEFCKLIRTSLAPEQPQDWVDVQSFIFQLGYYYMNRKVPGSSLSTPFDKFFTSLPEAETIFELLRSCMEQLGLTADATEDKRVALTLPTASQAIRFNFGNLVICSWFGPKPDNARFEFVCPSDFLPPCGIKSPGDFADQVDGQKVTLVKLPLSDLPAAQDHLDKGLALVKERFASWNGSPYRNSHLPDLFQMVFDPDYRANCLQNGFPAGGPAYVQEEPDLNPDPEEEQGFELYSIETAMQEVFIPRSELEAILGTLKRKQNIVLQGPPGVGKTFVAKRLAYTLMGCKDENRVTMVQFHQSYAYEDFVQGYRPDGSGGFAIKPGLLYEFAKKAQANPGQAYFLVIDELNRGNVSKIFGELMLLVEADKRGAEFAIPLTYSKNIDDKFYLPKNLHLIATMNTADRSLAVVDYALRRRFAFLTLAPAFRNTTFLRHLANCGLTPQLVEAICTRVEAINQLIEEDQANLGQGYKLGHSFFVPPGPVADEAAWYLDIVNHEVLPLLAEYWLDDDKRLSEVTDLLRR